MTRAGTVRMVMAGAVLALVLTGAVCEFPVFTRAFFPKKEMALTKRISEVRKRCAERFPLREGFVTLNGLCVRLAGQHLCNGVVRTGADDLLLLPSSNRQKMKNAARNMKRFADFCTLNGVAFVYVQAPKKLDVGQTLLSPGFRDVGYANVDDLLSCLGDHGVPFVDWRQAFSAVPSDVAKNFYRTDHHWNTDASFRATGLLAEEICRLCRVSDSSAAVARRLLSLDSWKREVIASCFLGSYGRRAGPYFAGCDDVTVLTPRFATKLTFEVPSKHIKISGSFRKTIMRRCDELKKAEDQFVSDAYSLLYVGGLYPYARSVNPKAPLDLKVMLIGDSYARPVSAFAATVVREVLMVDPRRRRATALSLAELVRRENPDVVIQIQNPGTFSADRLTGGKTGRKIMFEYGL